MTTDERRFAAIDLAEAFWDQVWTPGGDLDRVRPMVVPDVILTCGGIDVLGIDAFVDWIRDFRERLDNAVLHPDETFASVDASRVTSRWRLRGRNRGLLETPADGSGLEISGIGVWSVQWDRNTPRLARAWVERNLFEVWRGIVETSPQAVVR